MNLMKRIKQGEGGSALGRRSDFFADLRSEIDRVFERAMGSFLNDPFDSLPECFPNVVSWPPLDVTEARKPLHSAWMLPDW